VTAAVGGVLLMAGGALATWSAWWATAPVRAGDGGRWCRTNFRGAAVWLLGGPVLVLVAVPGLLAVAAAAGDPAMRRTAAAMALVATGAGAVGLWDDLRGATYAKGLRGHLTALSRGHVTTGAVKILGVGVAALLAGLVLEQSLGWRALVDALVIAGSANLVNLFDLRPGRAIKVALIAALPLLAVRRSAVALPLCWPLGVAFGLLPLDLRERVMLGDAGANALGGIVGVALVSILGLPQRLGVLAVVVALTLLSEKVSFSRVIEGTPLLRWADELGRPADAPVSK
jgi:UDP-GlcNAc:undecaprenyl-phosphate GlcNAc-1-phosphate transferase